MKETLESRFNAKILVTPGCWIWTESLGSTGYGQISVANMPRKAHRVSHELHVGPIPDGQCVLHRCDNPRCVNPAHLFLGTRTDNSADKVAKGRQSRGPSHGLRGSAHPMARLSEEQVAAIRSDQRPTDQIAHEYNVSKSLVVQIRAGKIWRNA